jgi:peptidoglycan-N-acetylglucosamine deacetylase
MREGGHDVAFHCVEHVRHNTMTRREIEIDVDSGLLALGRAERYWRAPWGLITPATEEVANKHRLLLVGWTADTEDWQGGSALERRVRAVQRPWIS